MAKPVDRGDLKSTTYEFFMLATAILSIPNLPLLFIFSRDDGRPHLRRGHADGRRRVVRHLLGFLANAFLSPWKRKPAETPPNIAEIQALRDRQEATAAQLRAKLEQLQAAR